MNFQSPNLISKSPKAIIPSLFLITPPIIPDNYEAFAREKFFMKKEGEEIYIIEFKDSIKN